MQIDTAVARRENEKEVFVELHIKLIAIIYELFRSIADSCFGLSLAEITRIFPPI